MKVLSWMVGAALLCSTQLTFANCDCAPKSCDLCDFDFCDVTYSAYVDYLYWGVCRADLNHEGGDDNTRYINPGYDSGYRLGVNFHYDCTDLGLRYTSFNTSQSRNPDPGEARYHMDLDVLDIELGRSIELCCADMTFRPFVGAKLAWLDEHFDKSENGSSDSKLDYSAYGLYLGTDARWNLCSWDVCSTSIPLAFVTRASVGILRASSHQKVQGEGEFTYHDECLYSPVFEAFVGLDFTFTDVLCGDANFLIGYEVQSWQGFRQFNDDDSLANFGMGGLVARFGYSF